MCIVHLLYIAFQTNTPQRLSSSKLNYCSPTAERSELKFSVYIPYGTSMFINYIVSPWCEVMDPFTRCFFYKQTICKHHWTYCCDEDKGGQKTLLMCTTVLYVNISKIIICQMPLYNQTASYQNFYKPYWQLFHSHTNFSFILNAYIHVILCHYLIHNILA